MLHILKMILLSMILPTLSLVAALPRQVFRGF
jgi:hypothetical protein